MKRYWFLSLIILVLLGACSSKEGLASETVVPTVEVTPGQAGQGEDIEATIAAQKEEPLYSSPISEDQSGQLNGTPYPGIPGSYPPPLPYPIQDGAYPSPGQTTPYVGVSPLADGSYPVPPTVANPWTGPTAETEVLSTPSLSETVVLSTPSPSATVDPNNPYPSPTGVTQTIPPTPTPTITATPTPLPPTPTPLPTRIPVSSRIISTDPETVELVSGSIQFIEFFAYWDGYSKAMAPIVHGLEARYGDQIRFIYLDIDDPRTKEFKLALGYEMRPHFFLLDGSGLILNDWQGLVEESELETAIQSALD